MKKNLLSLFLLIPFAYTVSGESFRPVETASEITSVQPMTGIVLWSDNEKNETDAISLEYSYMKYNDVVKQKGVYDWTVLENLLNDIASRNHQAVIRFYFVYPKDAPYRDGKTTVPDYVKNLPGYTEFKGKGDGAECYFPDWRNTELQDFALEFYAAFAEKYDNDPRLAFVQTGFGLWAEYHTWSGEFKLDGKTYKESKMVGIGFPSKEYQEKFLSKLNSVFVKTPWSISIDAADEDYTPMTEKPALKELGFGLFDDSFMSEEQESYNRLNWNFFGQDRSNRSPAGGEFNYYTTADQKGVLDPAGWRGRTYEQAAAQYHITYMIGNDQPDYRSMSRIKEASMASGYKFKLESFLVSDTESKITMKNTGVAPIYYDAYVAVNGVRSTESLKGLSPGEQKEFTVYSGGDAPTVSIECDRLLPGQRIEFEGNKKQGSSVSNVNKEDLTIVVNHDDIHADNLTGSALLKITDIKGIPVKSKILDPNNNSLNISDIPSGIYLYNISGTNGKFIKK